MCIPVGYSNHTDQMLQQLLNIHKEHAKRHYPESCSRCQVEKEIAKREEKKNGLPNPL